MILVIINIIIIIIIIIREYTDLSLCSYLSLITLYIFCNYFRPELRHSQKLANPKSAYGNILQRQYKFLSLKKKKRK